jgi:hypothetical protein
VLDLNEKICTNWSFTLDILLLKKMLHGKLESCIIGYSETLRWSLSLYHLVLALVEGWSSSFELSNSVILHLLVVSECNSYFHTATFFPDLPRDLTSQI